MTLTARLPVLALPCAARFLQHHSGTVKAATNVQIPVQDLSNICKIAHASQVGKCRAHERLHGVTHCHGPVPVLTHLSVRGCHTSSSAPSSMSWQAPSQVKLGTAYRGDSSPMRTLPHLYTPRIATPAQQHAVHREAGEEELHRLNIAFVDTDGVHVPCYLSDVHMYACFYCSLKMHRLPHFLTDQQATTAADGVSVRTPPEGFQSTSPSTGSCGKAACSWRKNTLVERSGMPLAVTMILGASSQNESSTSLWKIACSAIH